MKARIVNNGQSCIAAKRFIVHESIADEFEKRSSAAMEALKVGDPLDESTDIGPLATPQIVDDIETQVQRFRRRRRATPHRRQAPRRARQLLRADGPRRHPATTLPLRARRRSAPSRRSSALRDIDEAIRIANDTPFGLGASVWTNDRAEMDRFIDGIEAGQVFINAMVASDPRVPFGGIKHSGFGRELGVYGIREFVNVKTVWVG